MRLRVSQELENNKVRLDYINSPSRPSNTPSYMMNKAKADEFVSKYNKEYEESINTSILSLFTGIFVGLLFAIRKNTNRIKRSIIGISSGALLGLIFSAAMIRRSKNKLMDEYEVKRINNEK